MSASRKREESSLQIRPNRPTYRENETTTTATTKDLLDVLPLDGRRVELPLELRYPQDDALAQVRQAQQADLLVLTGRLDLAGEPGEPGLPDPRALVGRQLVLAVGLERRQIEDLELLLAGYDDPVVAGHVGPGAHAALGLERLGQRHRRAVEDRDGYDGGTVLQLDLLAEGAVDVLLGAADARRDGQGEDVDGAVVRARPEGRRCVRYWGGEEVCFF